MPVELFQWSASLLEWIQEVLGGETKLQKAARHFTVSSTAYFFRGSWKTRTPLFSDCNVKLFPYHEQPLVVLRLFEWDWIK
jgi:hypothetical protein